MSESRSREEALFEGALELPPASRPDYVKLACGDDANLRQRVEALLRANEKSGDFLEKAPPAAPQGTIRLSLPATDQAGERIGRYHLLQQIGEGGCGVVYMAEQEEPVRRRVALKVIKLGMDTKSVIARFEAERQALAMMDHPNIAKVLDAGATDNGRPFFVMELVRGIKITEYCDQNKLSTTDRLQLFSQVCHAIQHAHQKGIIHRDIKPSNILVTLHDGVPVPKVIDFGIAKATQGRLTDQTLFTAFEQFIGTPAYMSPEQAEMSGLDVDTRSDIYALGVLLYELLTGGTPFDAKELLESGIDALRRTIREREPDRPSTRLRTMLDADLTTVAQRRHAEAPKLISSLLGDLDWIVMKALEKDRTRRYETANGLAVDIQRYLTNEPVAARPPSTLYRLQKFARRNKLAVAAGSMVVVALSLGLIVLAVLLKQQYKARKLAETVLKLETDKRESAQRGEKLGQAALDMTQGRYAEAEAEINQLPISSLTKYKATAAIVNGIAENHARHKEWTLAATNYAKVIQVVPDDFESHFHLVTAFAELGDLDHWRQYSELLLQQFGGTSDSRTARRIVKEWLIFAPPAGDLGKIGKLMEVAALPGSDKEGKGENNFVQGLWEYRRGNFAAAAESFHKAAEFHDGDEYVHAEGLMGLALAQYQLKQIEEARETFSRAQDEARGKLTEPGDNYLGERWADWVIIRILAREARALMPDVKGSKNTAAIKSRSLEGIM